MQYSITVSRTLSATVSAEPKVPVIEYPPQSPVGDNALQITVNSADGQNTYDSNKFLIVSVSIKNVRTSRNIPVRSSDFELNDSDVIRYYT